METEIRRIEVTSLNAFWKKNQALKDISLSVESGKLTCITGPNGSGKSTLLSILAGLPEQGLTYTGQISLPTNSSIDKKKKDLPQLISYLPQTEESTWNFTGYDIILMGRFPHTNGTGFYTARDREIVEKTVEMLQIQELSQKSIFEMSGGEWQKIKIGRCLAQETPFILLDEPVANLDFSFQDQLLTLLKEIASSTGRGILATIHDINTASRFADSLILLPKNSPCIQGTPEEVLTEENLSLTYGGQKFGTFLHPQFRCTQVYPLQD